MHQVGLEGILKAGAQPIVWVSRDSELKREQARTETAPKVVDIVLIWPAIDGVRRFKHS